MGPLGLGLGLMSRAVLGGGGAPAPTFDTIVIEGDSISRDVTHPEEAGADTAGFFTTLWKATQPSKTIHIRAVNSRSTGSTANLNDNGNTLFGNVAEDAAYGPDLIAYMIGANDWSVDGGTTDAQYRTNQINLFAARTAAQPGVKVAWSPPLPYNPTGTPHPAKAWFDAQRASLMVDARNPAVWGQWADYYTPLGEHPDFADPATAAPLFSDGVHPSPTGHTALATPYAAAMDTILDPTRQNANTLYDAAWLTSETDLAVGGTITRRMIVSGLKWTGHEGGVSVTGAGSPSVKVGGVAGPSAYAYNGDVIDLTLTLSGSYETATSVDLTIGGETRTLSFTTAANVTPASYSHGDVVSLAGGDTTANFTGLTFVDGLAFAILQAPVGGPSTGVALDSNPMTLRRREVGSSGALELYTLPVAAGSAHALTATYAAFNAGRVLAYGTIVNGAFSSATGNATANEDNPHLTPSVTVPANGIAIAGFQEYGAAPITPATANTGTTFIDEGNVEVFGEALGIALGGRATTGSASFNFVFGTFARVIAVFEAA